MANDKKFRILPLAPRDDLDSEDHQFKVYHSFLTQAFLDPRICNIALSGSLGSGKSSILRSYDRSRNRNKRHFLYVSISDFSKSKPNKKQLEYCLLSQLLSCCMQDDLPEGSIGGIPERIRGLGLCASWLATMSFIVFVLVFHEKFGALADRIGIPGECRSLIHLILYLMLGITLGVVIYIVLRQCLVHLRLSKLTLKAGYTETEVVLGAEQTSLDRNKFELAYALSRIANKIDHTVVFEDFERIEEKTTAVEIMEKLRELNILTNNHIIATEFKYGGSRLKQQLKNKLQIWARGWKKYEEYEAGSARMSWLKRWMFDKIFSSTHIRFVYAISESTIDVEHRVKFYDCIIPVVPASNPLNGKDKLKEILANLGIHPDGQYTTRLVAALSPVMVDYRTLLTLQNEFHVLWEIYASRPEKKNTSEELDRATMLAVVAYKLLFPKAFEDALSFSGSGKLKRFVENDPEPVTAYSDAAHRLKCVLAIGSLFDAGLLDGVECLRMVIGEDQLLDHWLRVLSIELQTLDDPDSQKIVKSLTAQVKIIYKDGSAEQRKSCAMFRDKNADILCKLLDKPQLFSLAANCFAMVSGDKVEDWKWLITDVPDRNDFVRLGMHKLHFTMSFYFLEIHPQIYEVLISDLPKQLTNWSLYTLALMEKDEMVEQLKWSRKMAKLLADCISRDPEINGAYANLKSLFITKDRVALDQFLSK